MRNPDQVRVCWSLKVELKLDDQHVFHVEVEEIDGDGQVASASHRVPQDLIIDAKGRLAEYVVECAIRSLNEAARQRIRYDCPTFKLPLSWQRGPIG